MYSMKRMHVFIMWKYVFGNEYTQIWQRKNTGTINLPLRLTECSWVFRGILATNSRNVRCGIPIRATHYYNICNTSSQTVHNLFISWLLRILKTKTPFLHFKNHTFETQKPPFWRAKRGFCSVKKAGLHNKNKQPEKPLPIATMPNTHTPPHNNTTHSAHAYA